MLTTITAKEMSRQSLIRSRKKRKKEGGEKFGSLYTLRQIEMKKKEEHSSVHYQDQSKRLLGERRKREKERRRQAQGFPLKKGGKKKKSGIQSF